MVAPLHGSFHPEFNQHSSPDWDLVPVRVKGGRALANLMMHFPLDSWELVLAAIVSGPLTTCCIGPNACANFVPHLLLDVLMAIEKKVAYNRVSSDVAMVTLWALLG